VRPVQNWIGRQVQAANGQPTHHRRLSVHSDRRQCVAGAPPDPAYTKADLCLNTIGDGRWVVDRARSWGYSDRASMVSLIG
jgi:hypothetical protein